MLFAEMLDAVHMGTSRTDPRDTDRCLGPTPQPLPPPLGGPPSTSRTAIARERSSSSPIRSRPVPEPQAACSRAASSEQREWAVGGGWRESGSSRASHLLLDLRHLRPCSLEAASKHRNAMAPPIGSRRLQHSCHPAIIARFGSRGPRNRRLQAAATVGSLARTPIATRGRGFDWVHWTAESHPEPLPRWSRSRGRRVVCVGLGIHRRAAPASRRTVPSATPWIRGRPPARGPPSDARPLPRTRSPPAPSGAGGGSPARPPHPRLPQLPPLPRLASPPEARPETKSVQPA